FKHLLVGRQQPALHRAGVGVRSQTGGVSSWRATTDAVRVHAVLVRIEPLYPVRLELPAVIQKRVDIGGALGLACLHRRLGPVEREDFRTGGGQGAEEVITGTAVLERKSVVQGRR